MLRQPNAKPFIFEKKVYIFPFGVAVHVLVMKEIMLITMIIVVEKKSEN